MKWTFDLQEFDSLAGGALGDYSAKETTSRDTLRRT